MADPLTIYKITILYMLDKAQFPLSNTQFIDFFLERDYTDYFQTQNVLHDLQDADLITATHTHSNIQYTLTSTGKETLELFREKITEGIAKDVSDFFQRHELSMKQTNSIKADYYKTSYGTYAAHCQAIVDGKPAVDLTISVPGRTQAEAVCANWNTQAEEVYAALMELLMH